MKRLVLIFLCLCGLVSCKKQEREAHYISTDRAELSANKMGFSSNGSPLSLKLASNIYWTAQTDAEWVETFPVAGYGSETEVTLTISENTGEERTADIIFSAVDGTRTVVSVRQDKAETVLNYLTLNFENSIPVYSGFGSAPVRIGGEGYSITGDTLEFLEDGAFILAGPIQPHKNLAFSIRADIEGNAVRYISNKPELGKLLTEDDFYFDAETPFYLGISADNGAKLKSITVNEGIYGQGQFFRFSDGKPVGYVYFSDDFKWLEDFSDVDYIRTFKNEGEEFWPNLEGEEGFNPKGWSISDNALKGRVYCNCNCVKFGRAANSKGSGGGLITPAMDIPEECFSNVKVSIKACAFYTGSSFDAESALLFRIIGSGEIAGTGAVSQTVSFDESPEKKAIWDSSNVEYRVSNIWDDIGIEVIGASADTRFAIETTVETTKGRMLLSAVSIAKTGE
ncbi:MAG: BACON domain-containing protein [Bacteroidales bacterium]|nr:BACON domain-containing protein [Bacteroidales bacterium]